MGPHVSPFRAGPPQEPPEEERPPGVEGPPEASCRLAAVLFRRRRAGCYIREFSTK